MLAAWVYPWHCISYSLYLKCSFPPHDSVIPLPSSVLCSDDTLVRPRWTTLFKTATLFHHFHITLLLIFFFIALNHHEKTTQFYYFLVYSQPPPRYFHALEVLSFALGPSISRGSKCSNCEGENTCTVSQASSSTCCGSLCESGDPCSFCSLRLSPV